MIGHITISRLTSEITGPSFTVCAMLCVINLFVIFFWSSMTVCYKQSSSIRNLAILAACYVALGVLSIVVWALSIETAAEHSCSYKANCEYVIPSDFFGCSSKARSYFACHEPDVARGGDYFFSIWGSDCWDNGGINDNCRVFTSRSDCVNYKFPRDGDSDDCENERSMTAKEVVTLIAVVLMAITIYTMIPAVGLVTSAFCCRGIKQRQPNKEVAAWAVSSAPGSIELGVVANT